MKLEYSLSQFEANRINQVESRQLPGRRKMYWWITMPLTITGSVAAFFLNGGAYGVILAASMWLLIPMLTWYVLTVKHSSFSDGAAASMISGAPVKYYYEILSDSLIERVDGTERKIMLSDIQKHQFENGELKIQSSSAVITIPAGSTSRNQIERFSNSLSDCITRS